MGDYHDDISTKLVSFGYKYQTSLFLKYVIVYLCQVRGVYDIKNHMFIIFENNVYLQKMFLEFMCKSGGDSPPWKDAKYPNFPYYLDTSCRWFLKYTM